MATVRRVPRLRSGRLRAHGFAGVLGEYDGNNNLLRKYIYGPGIDQPVSMIEVADGNAAYYYHFDALGSVVALSDSAGDTVQTYQYSVYGEVAVEDANHHRECSANMDKSREHRARNFTLCAPGVRA